MANDEWLITADDLTKAITDVSAKHPTGGLPNGTFGLAIAPYTLAREILHAIDAMADGGDKPDPARSGCPSCSRGEDGGDWSCDCSVACGAPWCRYPASDPVGDLIGRIRGGEPGPDELDTPLSYDPEIQVLATVADALETLEPAAAVKPPGRREH